MLLVEWCSVTRACSMTRMTMGLLASGTMTRTKTKMRCAGITHTLVCRHAQDAIC